MPRPAHVKADRVISGIEGNQSASRIITEMLHLKQHEYGRGYLTAVSDLLPIVEAEVSSESLMRILDRFQVLVDTERKRG